MKHTAVSLLIIFCFCACDSKSRTQDEAILTCDSVSYMYTQINESGQAIDSLKLCASNYETTLDFYKSVDSISQTTPGLIYMSIFKIEGEKFAILVDTTTKVYKYTGKFFDKIYQMDCGIGLAEIIKNKLDVNADTHSDIVLEIPSGGTYGSDFIFLFYNPDLKTLEYDKNAKMRNCEIDLKNKQVRSNYNYSSTLFAIDKYTFRKIDPKK